jgi:hypothetical protein
MTDTGADMRTITLEKGLATFLNALSGKNRSAATIRAYQTDIAQFISFLHANNTDFSVVLFRPNFMLVSEEQPMKVHKNQWLRTCSPHLMSLGEPRTRAHTLGAGVQAPAQ